MMTDEQVVRTLAEFMGYVRCGNGALALWREDGCGRPNSYVREGNLPPYLTSYDALAPVWRRFKEVDRDRYANCLGGCGFHPWFEGSPRDHAHALCKAILESSAAREGR